MVAGVHVGGSKQNLAAGSEQKPGTIYISLTANTWLTMQTKRLGQISAGQSAAAQLNPPSNIYSPLRATIFWLSVNLERL
jgi:hypothetical protein